jgi:hypothetical protein
MDSSTKKYIHYEHAGVKWRSSYRVKIEDNAPKLIVHLANDGGFLYFNPSDLEVDRVTNDRHRHTTPSGWKVFQRGAVADGVKEKLADFKAFAVVWFGSDAIRQSVLYNPSSWRIDICFESKEHGVGLEFSFQADWPVAEENRFHEQYIHGGMSEHFLLHLTPDYSKVRLNQKLGFSRDHSYQ